MLKRLFHPKVLAIITMVLTCLMLFYDFVNIVTCIKHNLSIVSLLVPTLSSLFLLVYLLIILFSKSKNMKIVNNIFFIQLLIFSVINIILGVYSTFNNISNTITTINNLKNIDNNTLLNSVNGTVDLSTMRFSIIFVTIISSIIYVLTTISSLCNITITYGIALKKKVPYKIVMIISIAVTIIITILYLSLLIVPLVKSNYNIITSVIDAVRHCLFTIFMYQYGNSIIKRSVKDE